jgi:hypothetical protein
MPRLRGRSRFGEVKARPSIFLLWILNSMDARIKSGHDELSHFSSMERFDVNSHRRYHCQP